jgi:hypothetical protein
MPGTGGATTTAARVPVQRLVAENGCRGKLDPEYELLDTGTSTTTATGSSVHYAKADPHDLLMSISVTNGGLTQRAASCRRVVPEHLELDEGEERPELHVQGRSS